MKVSFRNDDLKRAVKAAARLARKGSSPLLQSIIVEAEGDGVVALKATDLNSSIVVKVAAEVSESGTIGVNGKDLDGLVGKLPTSDSVTFEVSGAMLNLRSRRSSYHLGTVDADDLPQMTVGGMQEVARIDAETLKEAIGQSVPFVSDEETRGVLRGVLFEADKDSLVMVATDTHRLSYISKPSEIGDSFKSVIILAPDLIDIAAEITPRSSDVIISQNESGSVVGFAWDELEFYAGVYAAQFPNYSKVIPKTFNGRFALPTDDTLSALGRIRVGIERNDGPGKKMVVSESGGNVELLDIVGSVTKGCEELPCVDGYAGGQPIFEPFRFAVNCGYFTDAVKAVKTDTFVVSWNNPLSPVKISPGGEYEGEQVLIVMPMEL